MVQYNSFNSWGWLDTMPPDIMASTEVVLGDVRDPNSAMQFAADAEVIYHLAALISIPYSYAAPRSYVDVNVVGTLNILEAARSHRSPRVVHTSTSEVYGSARRVPIDESHPIQAQSPYAATKAAADKLVESYHLSFDVPVVTLRPFNTYGPRQSARAIIPTIISQLAAGPGDVRLGALSPTRDFTFVTDTAEAFLAVGTAPSDRVVGRVLNSGTGREISIGELVTTIARIMGRTVEVREEPERLRPPDSEVQRLVCDSSELRTRTGWEPLHTLEVGLRMTAEWFLVPGNLSRYRWESYNV